MFCSPATLAVEWLALSASAALSAQDAQPAQPSPQQTVRTITITGAKELSPEIIRDEAGVREGLLFRRVLQISDYLPSV
jgi:hypothetical protein